MLRDIESFSFLNKSRPVNPIFLLRRAHISLVILAHLREFLLSPKLTQKFSLAEYCDPVEVCKNGTYGENFGIHCFPTNIEPECLNQP